ncbi:MAG: hypothetical protein CUN52_02270 [Phototrophicales bacterium]|nr:MAG: hypothetical protein CUN52_02270 [Phototrophicales bacterium]
MRKFITRISLVISLLLVVFATHAQTDQEENIGYIIHLARAGVITPLEDSDFYLMMLTNTADFNAVVVTSPQLFLFNYNLNDFVGDWEEASRAEMVITTGTLELNDYTIAVEVTVAPLAYDLLDNTFSYYVRFTGELPEEWVNKKGELLPEITFDRATLAININQDFRTALLAGYQARLSSTRSGGTANPPLP